MVIKIKKFVLIYSKGNEVLQGSALPTKKLELEWTQWLNQISKQSYDPIFDEWTYGRKTDSHFIGPHTNKWKSKLSPFWDFPLEDT